MTIRAYIYAFVIGWLNFFWSQVCSVPEKVRDVWGAMWDEGQCYAFCAGDLVTFLQDDGCISSVGRVVASFLPPRAGVQPCIDNEIVIVIDSWGQSWDVFYTLVSHNPIRRVFRPWRWVKGQSFEGHLLMIFAISLPVGYFLGNFLYDMLGAGR